MGHRARFGVLLFAASAASVWLLTLFFALPAAAQPGPAPDPGPGARTRDRLDAYEASAQALAGRVREPLAAAAVTSSARALIGLAAQIAGDFAVLYPPCGPYLGEGLGVREVLDEISLPALERDYHDGGALPEAPGFCYSALDLAVHPAAVVVLVRGGEVPDERIGAELAEALANLAAVRRFVALAGPRP